MSKNKRARVPCGDGNIYRRSRCAGAVRVEVADTAFAGAAGKVDRTCAAGEAAACDTGLDAMAGVSASESLAVGLG